MLAVLVIDVKASDMLEEVGPVEMIKAPRGTRDVLGDESWKWATIFSVCRNVADDFGFREIHLPIFEHTELFSRGIGETTDVVEKEMYTFTDRGGRSLTLRPEYTASCVRSYLEHDLASGAQPVKLWGAGPMFRYERPQKGRYRQFWQIDFESIGSPSALVDLEIIDASCEIYRRLGMKNLEVVVNSVGCPACRPVYRARLQEFLGARFEKLCETCQGRYDRNPLRILDCKTPECRELTKDAPAIVDCLCDECRAHFDTLLKGLEHLGASVKLDKRLVRGLDYYTKTAYEILSGDLGSQNAVCGGGRYDNLAEAIGGPHVPGVGFASGVERIALVMEGQGLSFGERPLCRAYIVAVGEEPIRLEALSLAHALRREGLSVDLDLANKNMKGQMKAAASAGVRYACILGDREIESKTVGVKDLHSGDQVAVSLDKLASYLKGDL